MHPYTTDSHERLMVPFWLATVSIVSAWILAWAIDKSGLQSRLWWVEVPSVFGFYGIFLRIFDRWLWKWKSIRAIGLVIVPDLSGVWTGNGVSLYDENGEKKPFDCTVTIEQQWMKLRVWLDTKTSESSSNVGAILIGGRRASLSYEYVNEPKALAVPPMNTHRGMARLELITPTELQGEYYSGRGRQTFGTLHLRKS